MEGIEENNIEGNNNYYKFLNSIIHKNEFLNNEYDSDFQNATDQETFFLEEKYDDIPEQIVVYEEVVLKKDKSKSNFYKYFFGSIFVVSSAITISYFFSKKRNKNKN